ncbi:MAG: radical SAM protein [Desulfobacteraceae bacterium]|nr:radical SAM protein [Desulfobacteraceae bacterium]
MPLHTERDFFIQWHLTERCNLRCRHCYQTGRRQDELATAEALAFIDEAAETVAAWSGLYGLQFASSFSITGGEPLLRPDLFELLAAMRARGFGVNLLSNGTLIDRGKAERLRELGVGAVQVSLEGPPAVNDAVRGAGSFEAAVRGVKHLAAAGLAVTLNMTLSRLNAGAFEEMPGLAASLGARRLGFARLVPAGRGRGLLGDALTPGELERLYRRIAALPEQGVELVCGDPLFARFREETTAEDQGDIPVAGCAAGLSGFTVVPNGTVMPCRRLPIPIGSIKEDSIRELWASAPLLERLRDRGRYQGACGDCPRWALCRGCRAVAYAFAGDPLAADPQCFLAG